MPSWAHLGIGGTEVLAQRQSGDDVALQPMGGKVANQGGDHGKKGIRGSNTFVATAALRLPAPNVVGIADTPVLLSPAGSSIHLRFAQALTAATTLPCPPKQQVALRVP